MGKKYFTRKRKYVLAALSMVMVLALVLQMAGTTAAAAIDLTSECTLTVQTAGDGVHSDGKSIREDLRTANIVLDVYKVADAVKVQGVDSYRYEFVAPFQGLTVEDTITSEGWRALSQQAAEIAFGYLVDGGQMAEGLQLVASEVPAGENSDEIEIGVAGSDNNTSPLECGLYLIVARGKDLKTDYADRVQMENTVTDEEGNPAEVTEEVLVSKARTLNYEYYFAPELVSLPGKTVVDENGEKIPVYTTDQGEWEYNVAVTLKPEFVYRFGSLQIVKNLVSYETAVGMKEPVTFVFQVDAVWGDQENFDDNELVYSNVVSITFTDPGRKESAVLERIPAGARVRVTEVYSGSSYEVENPVVEGLTITANDVVQAEFTNTYNRKNRSGYGINNEFTYNGNGWDWESDNWNWGPWVEVE